MEVTDSFLGRHPLVILATLCQTINVLGSNFPVEFCNTTRHLSTLGSSDGDLLRRVTVKMPEVNKTNRGLPLNCWFRFETEATHSIQVKVTNADLGKVDNVTQRCTKGFLRISEGEICSTEPDWLPPTTICNSSAKALPLKIKRLMRGQTALVEVQDVKIKPSKNFEFHVDLINNEGKDETQFPYGDFRRETGIIPDTKCDWFIPVDECFGSCTIVSPGYPGIYPPNTRCQYLLTSFSDKRIELKMGGRGFTGKFDMAKSENCSRDYVEVYDGATTVSPRIGRYCGHEGAHFISRGSSLLILFNSGYDLLDWNHQGFRVQVMERWRDHYKTGRRIYNNGVPTACDWSFDYLNSNSGDFQTPDYFLPNRTTCTYRFEAAPDQTVRFKIEITQLDVNCSETIEMIDGNTTIDKLCSHRVGDAAGVYTYHHASDGRNATIRYVKVLPQASNPTPIRIYYYFINPIAQHEPFPESESQPSQERAIQDNYEMVHSSAYSWNSENPTLILGFFVILETFCRLLH